MVLNELEIKGIHLDNDYLDIIKNAINVKKISLESGEIFSLKLDTVITYELKIEGISRNLIRHINNYRKKMKLSTKNRINLYIIATNDEIQESLNTYMNEILNQIQADNIFLNIEENRIYKNFKIGPIEVQISIEVL